MKRRGLAIALLACLAGPLAFVACGGDDTSAPSASDGGASDVLVAAETSPSDAAVDWAIDVDTSSVAGRVTPALLGHYDLSGALYDYPSVAGLASVLGPAGFREWRVGVGRWEAATQVLPTLTDNTSCAPLLATLPAQARAPAGTTDLDLIAARDWFTDDGQPVTEAMTLDDARYALTYVRKVLDAAKALGAAPYVGIDSMPRALAANRTPSRTTAALADACQWTWTNKVSNVRPADPAVFGAAATGLVKRVLEGSGSEPGRAVTHFEIWNEPELPYAWDPSFEASPGKLDQFFAMAAQTLVRLAAYRNASANANAKAAKFGLASFARADSAAFVLEALEQAGGTVPVDFFSFHAYANDPMAIVADIEKVTAARAASTHYKDAELVLSEWGPNLQNTLDPSTMDQPLLVSTVIALGATAGVARMHHTFFYDYFAGLPWGMVDHSLAPKPLYGAYLLLAGLIGDGADRLTVLGHADGRLDADGAAIASRGADGVVRVFLVNRGGAPRTVRVATAGAARTPSAVRVFSDPKAGVVTAPASPVVTLPARSIALVELR